MGSIKLQWNLKVNIPVKSTQSAKAKATSQKYNVAFALWGMNFIFLCSFTLSAEKKFHFKLNVTQR